MEKYDFVRMTFCRAVSLSPLRRRTTDRLALLLLLVAFVSLATAAPACASAFPKPAAQPAAGGPACQLRATTPDAPVAKLPAHDADAISVAPATLGRTILRVAPEHAILFASHRAASTQHLLVLRI